MVFKKQRLDPKCVVLGLEQNRIAMLLAVLHRHGGISMFDQNVFINVVVGIKIITARRLEEALEFLG